MLPGLDPRTSRELSRAMDGSIRDSRVGWRDPNVEEHEKDAEHFEHQGTSLREKVEMGVLTLDRKFTEAFEGAIKRTEVAWNKRQDRRERLRQNTERARRKAQREMRKKQRLEQATYGEGDELLGDDDDDDDEGGDGSNDGHVSWNLLENFDYAFDDEAVPTKTARDTEAYLQHATLLLRQIYYRQNCEWSLFLNHRNAGLHCSLFLLLLIVFY